MLPNFIASLLNMCENKTFIEDYNPMKHGQIFTRDLSSKSITLPLYLNLNLFFMFLF